jgi:hypothetical protein
VSNLYSEGIERLVKQVAAMCSGKWSPTPEHQELKDLEKQLVGLADRLDTLTSATTSLEEEHDKPAESRIGLDGLPIEEPNFSTSFKATLWNMRDLAGSARRAADLLPDSRFRPALSFAAMAFLHLRCQNDLSRPKLTDSGADVAELKEVCERAGLFRSSQAVRTALSKALEEFDAFYFPPGVWTVVTGKH